MDFTQDHEKYAEKCVATALSSEQDVDKALWLSGAVVGAIRGASRVRSTPIGRCCA
jgi:hypothetical protein